MANYKDIKGFTVQTLDTDPIASTPPTGAWAAGSNMNDVRPYGFGSGGVQTAAISFGGATSNDTANESYDGTSWTENPAMSNGYGYSCGTGSQTDAIAIGGLTTPPLSVKTSTEEWNGSSWTAGGSITTGRYNVQNQAYGPGTAAGFVGGKNPSYAIQALHEQYNGTSWTEVGDTPAPAWLGSSAGTQTANILMGGQFSGSTSAESFSWNGASWTDIGTYNTARYSHAASGVHNEALLIGGYTTAAVANTESYDGSSWTEIGDLSNARSSLGAGKTETGNTSAIAFGGEQPPYKYTEEFSIAPSTAQILNEGQVYFNSSSTNAFKVSQYSIPGGTWATGGSFPSTVVESGGIGSSASDGLVIDDASGAPNAFKYDGTSWTSAGSMGTWRKGRMLGAGSSTAGLMATGVTASPFPANKSVLAEEYNGSSWSEKGDLNTASWNNSAGRCGTSTSAIRAGGTQSPSPASSEFSDINESFNGTTWSEESELNTGRRSQAGTGSSNTDSFIIGGGVPPNNASALCEKWDGTSWTETGDLNTARYQNCAAGSTGSAITYGGNLYPSPPPYSALCESFNGSTWAEVGDLATGRQYLQGGGSTASGAIAVGGYGPPGAVTAETEEWSAPLGNKTITVS